jgi:hypothetical protein
MLAGPWRWRMRRKGLIEDGRRLATAAAVLAIAAVVTAAGEAADSPAAKEVADAVRAQGFTCTDAVSAERDPAESKPDEPVWILACSDARYRVRLMADMPAKIEPLQ